MNPNKALWEKGDFTRIAAFMRESGDRLVDSLKLNRPENLRILDLGCGDGTTALPLARMGASVLGVDIATNLVDAGNRRAAAEGLTHITFKEGDACDLQGIDDGAFDLTISIFGAMFAPRPADVARAMVRVTRPGGRIVMGNWIPNDPTSFVSQLLRISSSFTPPPPEGFISPMLWGVESHILDRFGQAGISPERITMTRDTFSFITSQPPSHLIDTFERFYGPTMNAVEAARKHGQEAELHRHLIELATAQNSAPDGTTSIPATFMRIDVAR